MNKLLNEAKLIRSDSFLILTFSEKRSRQVIAVLKTHFAANSSWKNWILFYLPLFDDYLKVYYIQDREFCIQPSGFSVNEGLCLISKEENEKLFLDVIQRLEIELGLTVLREA